MSAKMMFQLVFTCFIIYCANSKCNFWSCIHQRKEDTSCGKWKLSTAIVSNDCLYNCGEPIVAPDTGVKIVTDTLLGRETPKTNKNAEGYDEPYLNYDHMTHDTKTPEQYIQDKVTDAGKQLALIRADDCGAEYRFVLKIDKTGSDNPFKAFVSKSSKKTTTLDTTPDKEPDDMKHWHIHIRENDKAVETTPTERKSWPYNTIGFLWVGDTSCTMTLIAPKIGITAGHCIWNPYTKNWRDPKDMKFFPGSSNHWGYRGNTQDNHLSRASCGPKQNLCYEIRTVTIPMEHIVKIKRGDTSEYTDWAIVELVRETSYGYMAFGIYKKPALSTEYKAQAAGYPRGLMNYYQYKLEFPIYKKESLTEPDSVTKHKVIGNPTDKYWPGESGMSVWRASDKVIEGVFFGHVTESDIERNEGDTSTFEGAGIIDKKKYRMICAMLGTKAKTLCT